MPKTTNGHLGTQLKIALVRAVKWAKIQRKEAESMTLAWSQFVPDWRNMLRAFKRDQSKPNPFEEPDPGRFAFIYTCTSKLNNLDR